MTEHCTLTLDDQMRLVYEGVKMLMHLNKPLKEKKNMLRIGLSQQEAKNFGWDNVIPKLSEEDLNIAETMACHIAIGSCFECSFSRVMSQG